MEESRTKEQIVEEIKKCLDEYVQPAVDEHGGHISFVSFEDGVLNLMLGGACSGCAGSTMTLKMGVEQMIKHYVPEVQHVEAEDDPYSNVNPFYMNDPFMYQDVYSFDLTDNDDAA